MKTVVSIPGMHCESCTTLVKDVSSEFPAITAIAIDIKTKRVELDHTGDFDFASWSKEVESLGDTYRITKIS